MNKDHHFT